LIVSGWKPCRSVLTSNTNCSHASGTYGMSRLRRCWIRP
jgi:hypothetical protein